MGFIDDPAFTDDQHAIWTELFRRQVPRVEKWAASEYLDGFDRLQMPPDRIPSLAFLNSKITPATGWTIVRTDVRYSDPDAWYEQFAKKNFMITNYMRSWEEIDWTPEPDMFHDIFGHLPFMTLPEYGQLQEMFAPTYLRCQTQDQKDNIDRLAWFSTEFGIKIENGERKIFGTGLMSGGDEMERAANGVTPLERFTIENVIQHDKAVDEMNPTLFWFETMDELKAELASYFDTI